MESWIFLPQKFQSQRAGLKMKPKITASFFFVLHLPAANGMIYEPLNKSRRTYAGAFSVMLCQMSFDVAMLRLRAIFRA